MLESRTSRAVVRVCVALTACCALALPAVHTWADPPPGRGGGGGGGGGPATFHDPVIISADHGHIGLSGLWNGRKAPGSMSVPVMMKPSGRGFEHILCPSLDGDVTHGGGVRFVADFFPTDTGDSDGIMFTSDDCLEGAPTYSVVAFDDPDFVYPTGYFDASQVRWSIDGTRLAFGAVESGVPGIFVGEVLFDVDDRPAGLSDGVSGPNTVRRVATTSEVVQVRWSGDNVRLTYAASVGADVDVFVLDVDSLGVANVTDTDLDIEGGPNFSPVPGDNRIAFVRLTAEDVGGEPADDRWDIFVLDLDTGAETQITDESNADIFRISFVEWSPDAQSFAFKGGSWNGGFLQDVEDIGVYTMKADGSRRAKQITSPKVIQGNVGNIINGPPRWR